MLSFRQNGPPSHPPNQFATGRSVVAARRKSRSTEPAPRRASITLADTRRCGFQLSMLMPTFLLGLGTTGSKIVHNVMSLLINEAGEQPKSCEYLMIDGAVAQAGMDPNHHKALKIDGCGTLPSEGCNAFRTHWEELLTTLTQMVLGLSSTDARVPASKTVREALDVRIIAGCGGSGGGMLHEAISLIWQVGRRLNISDLRINLVLIGAEMPLGDTSRSVVLQQRLIVSDTIANNLAKTCGDFANNSLLSELPAGDAPFAIRASQRVASNCLIDKSNGHHDFAVTDQLVAMAAQGLMAQLFTHAGQSIEERSRDLDALGTYGRGARRSW